MCTCMNRPWFGQNKQAQWCCTHSNFINDYDSSHESLDKITTDTDKDHKLLMMYKIRRKFLSLPENWLSFEEKHPGSTPSSRGTSADVHIATAPHNTCNTKSTACKQMKYKQIFYILIFSFKWGRSDPICTNRWHCITSQQIVFCRFCFDQIGKYVLSRSISYP